MTSEYPSLLFITAGSSVQEGASPCTASPAPIWSGVDAI